MTAMSEASSAPTTLPSSERPSARRRVTSDGPVDHVGGGEDEPGVGVVDEARPEAGAGLDLDHRRAQGGGHGGDGLVAASAAPGMVGVVAPAGRR